MSRPRFRVGQGMDAHRLAEGRELVLGGVPIEHDRGLDGHSDGDVLLHAIASALLGAVGHGDLGRHFPSSSHELEGISSRVILERVARWVREDGYEIANVDATIVAQEPRFTSFWKKYSDARRLCTKNSNGQPSISCESR